MYIRNAQGQLMWIPPKGFAPPPQPTLQVLQQNMRHQIQRDEWMRFNAPPPQDNLRFHDDYSHYEGSVAYGYHNVVHHSIPPTTVNNGNMMHRGQQPFNRIDPPTPQVLQNPPVHQMIQNPPVPRMMQNQPVSQMIQNSPVPRMIQNPPVPRMIQNPQVPRMTQNSPVPRMIQNPQVPRMTQNSPVPRMIQNPPVPRVIQNPPVSQAIHSTPNFTSPRHGSMPPVFQNPPVPQRIQNSPVPRVIQNPTVPRSTQNLPVPQAIHTVPNFTSPRNGSTPFGIGIDLSFVDQEEDYIDSPSHHNIKLVEEEFIPVTNPSCMATMFGSSIDLYESKDRPSKPDFMNCTPLNIYTNDDSDFDTDNSRSYSRSYSTCSTNNESAVKCNGIRGPGKKFDYSGEKKSFPINSQGDRESMMLKIFSEEKFFENSKDTLQMDDMKKSIEDVATNLPEIASRYRQNMEFSSMTKNRNKNEAVFKLPDQSEGLNMDVKIVKELKADNYPSFDEPIDDDFPSFDEPAKERIDGDMDAGQSTKTYPSTESPSDGENTQRNANIIISRNVDEDLSMKERVFTSTRESKVIR